MNEKRKRFWQFPIGEALLWPLPALLAAFANLYAFPKAELPGAGPGVYILMNEETIRAQQIWQFANSLPHPFLLYGLLLIAVYTFCRLLHIRAFYRIFIFIMLAIPGLWYLGIESYLGGKILLM